MPVLAACAAAAAAALGQAGQRTLQLRPAPGQVHRALIDLDERPAQLLAAAAGFGERGVAFGELALERGDIVRQPLAFGAQRPRFDARSLVVALQLVAALADVGGALLGRACPGVEQLQPVAGVGRGPVAVGGPLGRGGQLVRQSPVLGTQLGQPLRGDRMRPLAPGEGVVGDVERLSRRRDPRLGRGPLGVVMTALEVDEAVADGAVLAGHPRLALQRADARLELGEDVAQAHGVGRRLGQPALGVVGPQAQAGNAGRVLEQAAALLRALAQSRIHQPLADDRVRLADRRDELLDVLQPHPAAVDQILVLAAAKGAAGDRDLAERQRQVAVGVVERQDDLGHRLLGALVRTGEDDIVGSAAAQVGVALLAEHPAQRLGHVRLARPVRPDDRGDPAVEDERRRAGEALEPVYVEPLEENRHPALVTPNPSASGLDATTRRGGGSARRAHFARPASLPRRDGAAASQTSSSRALMRLPSST